MVQVGVHRHHLSPKPTLWERMLAIVLLVFPIEITRLVLAECIFGNARIHIPHRAVAALVRGSECSPKIVVRLFYFRLDDAAERSLQGSALLAVGVLIVIARTVRPGSTGTQSHKHSCQCNVESSHCLLFHWRPKDTKDPKDLRVLRSLESLEFLESVYHSSSQTPLSVELFSFVRIWLWSSITGASESL